MAELAYFIHLYCLCDLTFFIILLLRQGNISFQTAVFKKKYNLETRLNLNLQSTFSY